MLDNIAAFCDNETMINEIKGNLLNFPAGINVAAHSANCQNTMGSGIALQVRQRFPKAWEADCRAAKAGDNRLGNISYAFISPKGTLARDAKAIFNLYTQDKFGANGRFVNYEAFYIALEKMIEKFKTYEDMSDGEWTPHVGVPKRISADRAGGSWNVIMAMLIDVFAKNELSLTIVDFDPTQA